MNEKATKKKTTRKRVARRNPTIGIKKEIVFKQFCLALARENWEGATALRTLYNAKGNITSLDVFLDDKAFDE